MTKDRNFSLSAVLKYRKNVEEEVSREAASLKRILEKEELLLMEMEASKKKAATEYMGKNGLTVEEINLFHSFISTLDAEISRQKKKVLEMAREYEMKREVLLSAAIDKKIMETMRDREWDDYKRIIWLTDQKNMDEIAVNSYCRNQ